MAGDDIDHPTSGGGNNANDKGDSGAGDNNNNNNIHFLKKKENDKDNSNKDNSNADTKPGQKRNQTTQKKNPPSSSDDEKRDERRCRFCLYGVQTDDDDPSIKEELIAPCDCSGSSKWIHRSCLRKWQHRVQVDGGNHPAQTEREVRDVRERFNINIMFIICSHCKSIWYCVTLKNQIVIEINIICFPRKYPK
jgi:hypothetical protein